MDCIFCNIITGHTPAELIYEDEQVVAFDDLNPKAPCHKLVIPKKHIATLNDADPKDTFLLGHLIHTATQIAQQLKMAQNGYRLTMNCNAEGGQTVFHIHLHLLGGRMMNWPPG